MVFELYPDKNRRKSYKIQGDINAMAGSLGS